MRDLKALVEELANGKAWARPGYDGKPSREIESTVVLGKAKDGNGEVVLELSASHDKERKQYYARVQISTQKTEGAFKVNSYSLFDKETGARLDQVDSPRYSAKALEAFWELQIGKLRDDPNILTALNLDHNQEPPAEPEEEAMEGWFFAKELTDPIKAEGLKVNTCQSGGGTATLYIEDPNKPQHDMFLVGPGSYNWGNPDMSQFTMDELSYGLDHWEDDGEEMREEEPESVSIDPSTSVPDAAKQIVAAFKKHHNL